MDIDIIKRAQQGEPEALTALSTAITAQVTTYLFRLTLDYHLAEDLCQETLMRLLRHLPHLTITQPDDLWAWIRRAALSRVQDEYRRHSRRQRRHEETMKRYDRESTAAATPSEVLVRHELGRAVWQAMARLTLHYRHILVLRCLDDLSYAQIAAITGQTQLQARLLFFRAKKSLKRELGRQGVGSADLVKALTIFAGATWTGAKAEAASVSLSASSMEVPLSTVLVGTMVSKLSIATIVVVTAGLATVGTLRSRQADSIRRGGPMGLSHAAVQQIDNKVGQYLHRYDFLNIALIEDANVVFTSAYGRGAAIDRVIPCQGATPFIATLVLMFHEKGLIENLDDPIERYSPAFSELMPARYAGVPLTFRHCLLHTSGVVAGPHKDKEPVWQQGRLNLRSRPGSDVYYSDTNYALLELALEQMTGKTLDRLLDDYIETPVQADSFTALAPDDPFVAGVACTVSDAARFLSGLLKGQYLSRTLLEQEVWRPQRLHYGLGWFLLIPDQGPARQRVVAIFHFSQADNGNEAMIHLNKGPHTAAAIVLGHRKQGRVSRSGPNLQLAIDLATILR